MKLKLISDGTTRGTQLVNMETGEEVENLRDIYWLSPLNDVPTLLVEMVAVPVEITAEGNEVKMERFSVQKKMVETVEAIAQGDKEKAKETATEGLADAVRGLIHSRNSYGEGFRASNDSLNSLDDALKAFDIARRI